MGNIVSLLPFGLPISLNSETNREWFYQQYKKKAKSSWSFGVFEDFLLFYFGFDGKYKIWFNSNPMTYGRTAVKKDFIKRCVIPGKNILKIVRRVPDDYYNEKYIVKTSEMNTQQAIDFLSDMFDLYVTVHNRYLQEKEIEDELFNRQKEELDAVIDDMSIETKIADFPETYTDTLKKEIEGLKKRDTRP